MGLNYESTIVYSLIYSFTFECDFLSAVISLLWYINLDIEPRKNIGLQKAVMAEFMRFSTLLASLDPAFSSHKGLVGCFRSF